MAQILDPLPPDHSDYLFCCYVNATSQIQIARITNIENWYFERVVFPGQKLLFEAPPEAYLEIHTGMMASAIISDKIPCRRLVVKEEEEITDNITISHAHNITLDNPQEHNSSTVEPLFKDVPSAI